jgi:hypothetical protein
MGIPSLHQGITTAIMERFHFAPAARDLAAAANAAIDEKQGNSARETNLHAMCGFVDVLDPVLRKPMQILQNDEQCRAGVHDLLVAAKADIAKAVLAGDYRTGIHRLGQALHTVQDRAFHNFEPWPYRGLADAVLSDPNYMICHAVRDLGVNLGGIGIGISRLDIWELPAGRFDFELSARIGGRVFLGGRVFSHATAPEFWQTPLGRDGTVGPLGTGGMVTLSFGAPPGSVSPPERFPSSATVVPNGRPTWSMATSGPAAQARAEDASADFIREVELEVNRAPGGSKAWTGFLKFQGERAALDPPQGRSTPAVQFASPNSNW